MGCWLMDLYRDLWLFYFHLMLCQKTSGSRPHPPFPPLCSSIIILFHLSIVMRRLHNAKTRSGGTTQGKIKNQGHNTSSNQPPLLGITKSSTNLQCVNFNSLDGPKIGHGNGHYLALTVLQGNNSSTPALLQAAKASIPTLPILQYYSIAILSIIK